MYLFVQFLCNSRPFSTSLSMCQLLFKMSIVQCFYFSKEQHNETNKTGKTDTQIQRTDRRLPEGKELGDGKKGEGSEKYSLAVKE